MGHAQCLLANWCGRSRRRKVATVYFSDATVVHSDKTGTTPIYPIVHHSHMPQRLAAACPMTFKNLQNKLNL